ncbi:alpha/beta hydrolase [soil metagenome]
MKVGARAALQEPLLSLLVRDRRDDIERGIDKQVAGVLELQRRMKLPSLETMEPVAARRFAEEGLSPLEVDRIEMARVVDALIPRPATDGIPTNSISARIFVPREAGPDWLVYFHGGGGTIGSPRASEPITRYIANATRMTVASVDYRLGPEHKHPAAIEDAVDAFHGIAARVPSGGKIAIAGDSFGGFLCAHVDRTSELRPAAQLLIYPITDLTMSSSGFLTHGDGYLYTRAIANYFKSHYLRPDADRRAASPAFFVERGDNLANAAPAIIVTAGFDPLGPEGDAYAQQLRAANARVVHRRYRGLVHGFLSLAGGVRVARAAVDEMCADLTAILR